MHFPLTALRGAYAAASWVSHRKRRLSAMWAAWWEVKNHRFLLKAFSICHRAVPAAQLLLIGDGPLEQMLRTQAADLGIQGSVHFLGSRRDTRLLYAAMDVFAMPSLYEGLSMALLEAQASGLPCLASDTCLLSRM